jgi:uncharacterized membrane protein HdeD (DUF308 family)
MYACGTRGGDQGSNMSDKTTGWIFIVLGIVVVILGFILIPTTPHSARLYMLAIIFGGALIIIGWRFLYGKVNKD